MAFCTKCGTQMSDDAKFCPVCGTQTNAAPNFVAAPAAAKIPVSDSCFGNRMRQFITRNNQLFLIGLCCMAVEILLSFISEIDHSGFNGSTILSLLISAVPAVAILLLWLEAPKTAPFSNIGLMIIKIMSIVYMVLMGILAIIAIAGQNLVADIVKDAGVYGDAFNKISGVLTVVLLIVVALAAGFYALIMLHANKLLKALKTNVPPEPAGALVIVLWILAGFSILGAIFSISGSALGLISNLASAGSVVIFAVLATKANNEL